MRRTTFVTLALAASSACGSTCCGPKAEQPYPEDAPARYAAAVCSTYERCGCMGDGFENAAACTSANEAVFRNVAEWDGMIFDEDCFEETLQAIDGADCGGPQDTDFRLTCLVFKDGGKPRGAECVPDWSEDFRKAHQGLLAEGQCREGYCYDGTCGGWEAPTTSVGQPCYLQLGVYCDQSAYCGRDGTCHETALPGEPCDTPRACGADYYCDGVVPGSDTLGTCREKIVEGEACDPQNVESCVYPAYCGASGTCETAWPQVCFYATSPQPDYYYAHEWVPVGTP